MYNNQLSRIQFLQLTILCLYILYFKWSNIVRVQLFLFSFVMYTKSPSDNLIEFVYLFELCNLFCFSLIRFSFATRWDFWSLYFNSLQYCSKLYTGSILGLKISCGKLGFLPNTSSKGV